MDGNGNQRLWTPWRMRYVGGGAREPGCIFCNRIQDRNDVESLILHRGETVVAILNRYPYSSAHSMIIPVEHLASPESAAPAILAETAQLSAPLMRAMRRMLNCDGFNLGANVGAVAGAGVADHLHYHVVPRWTGDANFMPIIASTTVMPETLPVTYAKLRAELENELRGDHPISVVLVLLSADGESVLTDPQGGLPAVTPADAAVWRAAAAACAGWGLDAELLHWAGPSFAGDQSGSALLLRSIAHAQAPTGYAWLPLAQFPGSAVPGGPPLDELVASLRDDDDSL